MLRHRKERKTLSDSEKQTHRFIVTHIKEKHRARCWEESGVSIKNVMLFGYLDAIST